MKESFVRNRIRRLWGPAVPALTWIEPGPGSTAGAPDLLLPIGQRLAPVELKVGSIVGGRLVAKVRPIQWAWHYGMSRGKVRSYFIVGVSPVELIVCDPRWLAMASEAYEAPKARLLVGKSGRNVLVNAIDIVDKKSSLLVACNRGL